MVGLFFLCLHVPCIFWLICIAYLCCFQELLDATAEKGPDAVVSVSSGLSQHPATLLESLQHLQRYAKTISGSITLSVDLVEEGVHIEGQLKLRGGLLPSPLHAPEPKQLAPSPSFATPSSSALALGKRKRFVGINTPVSFPVQVKLKSTPSTPTKPASSAPTLTPKAVNTAVAAAAVAAVATEPVQVQWDPFTCVWADLVGDGSGEMTRCDKQAHGPHSCGFCETHFAKLPVVPARVITALYELHTLLVKAFEVLLPSGAVYSASGLTLRGMTTWGGLEPYSRSGDFDLWGHEFEDIENSSSALVAHLLAVGLVVSEHSLSGFSVQHALEHPASWEGAAPTVHVHYEFDRDPERATKTLPFGSTTLPVPFETPDELLDQWRAASLDHILEDARFLTEGYFAKHSSEERRSKKCFPPHLVFHGGERSSVPVQTFPSGHDTALLERCSLDMLESATKRSALNRLETFEAPDLEKWDALASSTVPMALATPVGSVQFTYILGEDGKHRGHRHGYRLVETTAPFRHTAWALVKWFTVTDKDADKTSCGAIPHVAQLLLKEGAASAKVAVLDVVVSRPGFKGAAHTLLYEFVRHAARFAWTQDVFVVLDPLHKQLQGIYETVELPQHKKFERFTSSILDRWMHVRLRTQDARASGYVPLSFQAIRACTTTFSCVKMPLAAFRPVIDADADYRKHEARFLAASTDQSGTFNSMLEALGIAVARQHALAQKTRSTLDPESSVRVPFESTVQAEVEGQILRCLQVSRTNLENASSVESFVERFLPKTELCPTSQSYQSVYAAFISNYEDATAQANKAIGNGAKIRARK